MIDDAGKREPIAVMAMDAWFDQIVSQVEEHERGRDLTLRLPRQGRQDPHQGASDTFQFCECLIRLEQAEVRNEAAAWFCTAVDAESAILLLSVFGADSHHSNVHEDSFRTSFKSALGLRGDQDGAVGSTESLRESPIRQCRSLPPVGSDAPVFVLLVPGSLSGLTGCLRGRRRRRHTLRNGRGC